MPQEHVVSIDPSKPLGEEPGTGHNRWHEAIEPVVEVDPGDTIVYETRDAFDGQLNGESTAEDVGNLDLSGVHPLTGPVFVKGAEPGDLLEVKLVAVEADPWEQWGYTVEVPGFVKSAASETLPLFSREAGLVVAPVRAFWRRP